MVALGVEAGLSRGEAFPVDTIRLPLTVVMNGDGEGADGAGGEAGFLEHARARVQEAIRGARAFTPGAVYCFYTDGSDSADCRPQTTVDVFAGYTANGRPAWRSFVNLCLEVGDPDVDRIFDAPPQIIGRVQTAADLTGELLPSFGADSMAYSVLGQVVMGLVPRDLNPRNTQIERVALTIQVVETTRGTSAHRWRLNVIGLEVDEILQAAADSHARSPAEAFRKLLRGARQRVERLGRQATHARRRSESFDADKAVLSFLTRLRGDLLRALKGRHHRTRHADERHQSGERPTSQAMRDAAQAKDDRLFWDVRRNTGVVVGPHARVHIFSMMGQHITSLDLDRGEVARKVERKRWRPMTAAERAGLRAAIRAQ